MKANGFNLTELLAVHTTQTEKKTTEFFEAMQSKGYIPTDKPGLTKALETNVGSGFMSITKLTDYHK